MQPENITAIGCHGQTIRHAPEHQYSIQLVNLPLLAERTGILPWRFSQPRPCRRRARRATRSRVPPSPVCQPSRNPRGTQHRRHRQHQPARPQPAPHRLRHRRRQHAARRMDTTRLATALRCQRRKSRARQSAAPPVGSLKAHPYFRLPPPKSTGRELFSLAWLQSHLRGNESPFDVQRTLVQFTAETIADAIFQAASNTRHIYICGGGIQNTTLMHTLAELFAPHNIALHSTARLNLNPPMGRSRRLRMACRLLGKPNPLQPPPRHRRTQAAYSWRRLFRIKRQPENGINRFQAAYYCCQLLHQGYGRQSESTRIALLKKGVSSHVVLLLSHTSEVPSCA